MFAPGASPKGRSGRQTKSGAFGSEELLRVSMCQIAMVSFLAMSTRATLAPRCLPSRRTDDPGDY